MRGGGGWRGRTDRYTDIHYGHRQADRDHRESGGRERHGRWFVELYRGIADVI